MIEQGRTGQIDLKWLLRHHNKSAITDRETTTRDKFDYLLAYYGILEVALISGAVQRLPATLQTTVLRNVSNVYVRRYYEQNYPILLPQLILRRLTGDLTLAEDSCSVAAFMDFVTLTHRLETDPHIESLLWFLDGGTRDGYSFEDVIHALSHSKIFAKEIDIPKPKPTQLGSALHGFRKFLIFARYFHDLIESNLRTPLFAAAMYHAHGYWFDHLSDELGNDVGAAAEAAIGPRQQGELVLSQQEIEKAARAVRKLCKSHYGEPLLDLHPMFAA